MSKSANTIGWHQNGDNLTPAALTGAYPFKQQFFPASIMSLHAGQEPIFQTIQIAAQVKFFDVITFATGVVQGVSWIHSFKSNEIDTANPSFKVMPIWFQSEDAANPNQDVEWEFYFENVLLGNSMNVASPSGNNFTTRTQAQWVVASGPNGAIEDAVAVSAIGDTLSAANANTLQFQLERHGDEVGDTYTKDAHLLGMMVQWKTNFENIAEWPV